MAAPICTRGWLTMGAPQPGPHGEVERDSVDSYEGLTCSGLEEIKWHRNSRYRDDVPLGTLSKHGQGGVFWVR